VRDYLNEGGKVFLGGKHAGQQYFEGFEFRNEGFPQPNEDKHGDWCDADLTEDRDGCIAHTNDFFQYYLGAYLRVEDGGSWTEPTDDSFVAGQPYPVRPLVGVSPFTGSWTPAPQGGDATVGAPTSTLASTSSLLDTEAYADFSEVVASWDRLEAGPFTPHGGSQYLFSGAADQVYKRLSTQIEVPAGGGTLTFWTSFDIEQDWDFFFVEAAPAGTDEWTTLPDRNGHTTLGGGTQNSCWDGTGWGEDLHPRLLNYQTDAGTSCDPTGTTGEWNAATGSSGGWQKWSIDLSADAGQTIDLAIVHATDWGTLNLGVWLDDITIDACADSSTTDFEGTDLGAWQSGPGLPESPNPAQWPTAPSTQSFQEGAVIGTKDLTFVDAGMGTEFVTSETRDTLYAGFEPGTLSAAEHASFMREVLEYFGLAAEND